MPQGRDHAPDGLRTEKRYRGDEEPVLPAVMVVARPITPGVVTVKLVESHGHALSIEGALPTGYGLGKAGWVTVPSDDEDVDLALLCDWVEESYRIVAPKRLLALLDAASG